MGKVPATPEMKKHSSSKNHGSNSIIKRKGRPPKNPIVPLSTPPKTPNYDSTPNRRSSRRNPSNFSEFDDDDDDDDERKEKKVKLVVRLPQSDDKNNSNSKVNQKLQRQQNRRHSRGYDSGSGSGLGSDSDPDSEDRQTCAKKRKISAVDAGSDGPVSLEEKKAVKETDIPLHGSPLESGPTNPLPDKKLLVFILDRLQKKDTYGVFSEPVDPDELPDYFDIIEQPMDFGTVRKKLDGGVYGSLDELEVDVFLICSNAMQYNAPDTVYYRQAHSIQDLAKRDFENLRQEGVDGEPKVVRRGRPPSNKNLKKAVEASSVDRVGPELSSGATLANAEDKGTESSSAYNLRKASALYRFRPNDSFVSSSRSRNGENYYEFSADWNNEFPASILRADLKYGKKNFIVDETRRDTYGQFHPLSFGNRSSVLSNSIGDMRRLIPVGLQEPLSYARSLARYAATLGPVAWKLASKRIESILPPGLQYGPGWIGEHGAPSSQPLSFSTEKQKSSNGTSGDCNSSKIITPSTSDLSSAVANGPYEGMMEAVKKLNSQNEASVHGDASLWMKQFPVQQRPVYPSQGNFYSGMYGFPVAQDNKMSDSSHGGEAEMLNFGKLGSSSWQTMTMPVQQRRNNISSVPPDLNVKIPAVSPNSSLQIGSPQQQPDLALQL